MKTVSVARALLIVGALPLAAQVLGSIFNIWYNLLHIRPLLTPEQAAHFQTSILIFNVLVYPPLLVVWFQRVLSLKGPMQAARDHVRLDEETMLRARRLAINLPWWAAAVAGTGWFLCIPALGGALWWGPGDLDPRVIQHLSISIVIAALIALTHVFFAVEITSQRLLYPFLFQEARPSQTPGAKPLSLNGRGLLWAVSAGVCPIVSLLLLLLAPDPDIVRGDAFGLAVGGLGIFFGLTGAWLLSRLVVEPVEVLRNAAREVAKGNVAVHIDLLRADEFGPLIDEFNQMVEGLREKRWVEETFGRHVGRQTARELLKQTANTAGVEREVTVMFMDIRSFTTRCAALSPRETVDLLNRFFSVMVTEVEERGGMVNKFLGDGFMALFGATGGSQNHAAQAVEAARGMLAALEALNTRRAGSTRNPVAIGIGLHTGPAVVGSVGSPQRLEYTAIGDTVNVASRVEGLCAKLGDPFLISSATLNQLPNPDDFEALPPQSIKGKSEPMTVYRLKSSATSTVTRTDVGNPSRRPRRPAEPGSSTYGAGIFDAWRANEPPL